MWNADTRRIQKDASQLLNPQAQGRLKMCTHQQLPAHLVAGQSLHPSASQATCIHFELLSNGRRINNWMEATADAHLPAARPLHPSAVLALETHYITLLSNQTIRLHNAPLTCQQLVLCISQLF
jgi:hypothetical protein